MGLLQQMLERRPKPKNWKGQKFNWLEAKMDGRRMTIVKEADGSLRMISKELSQDYYRFIRDTEIGRTIDAMPFNTIVDGELYVPGEFASYVPTACRQSPDELEFDAFAIPCVEGQWDTQNPDPTETQLLLQDLGFDQVETCSMEDLIKATQPGHIRRPGWELTRSHTASRGGLGEARPGSGCIGLGDAAGRDTVGIGLPGAGPLRTILDSAARGSFLEGYVLKEYSWGSWWKTKPVREADCVITGFNEAKIGSKYEGLLGSVKASLYHNGDLVEVAKVSGWSDEQRETFTESDLIGRVIEVRYDRIDAKGRMRFPRFLRFRDQKRPEECFLDQLS